ncbi:hypothetical protein M878_00925 [Streptomyces roseochromogenus subsp. oscitans DS 12.976]|uniref:Uncharacterized protein n=1 Tax=Streptomyces roseochromogenus subsp. oscitans DS 12.976 TaxID=1352936 RepID=V6KX21_STRRC|nr:hypothetical protein M878_00925 [Streptomyces roseochromogenus subsp. oscitans DS 12.976]
MPVAGPEASSAVPSSYGTVVRDSAAIGWSSASRRQAAATSGAPWPWAYQAASRSTSP